jgi:hypothetical protein
MTIGHVAVVGGVLLAGDNPSTWQAITSEVFRNSKITNRLQHRSSSITQTLRRYTISSLRKRRITLPRWVKDWFYHSGFSSEYRTAWMWSRGSTKAMWIAKFGDEYPELDVQRKVLKIGFFKLVLGLALPATILFLVPAFLGGMARQASATPSIQL